MTEEIKQIVSKAVELLRLTDIQAEYLGNIMTIAYTKGESAGYHEATEKAIEIFTGKKQKGSE